MGDDEWCGLASSEWNRRWLWRAIIFSNFIFLPGALLIPFYVSPAGKADGSVWLTTTRNLDQAYQKGGGFFPLLFGLFVLGLFLLFLSFLFWGRGRWLKSKYNDDQRKCVLISGCDTGFGNLLARRLDKMGYEVIAGCYNIKGDHAQTLVKETSNRVHCLPMDVTNEKSVRLVVQEATKICGERGLWALVNNAGINKGLETDLTEMKDFRDVMEVNLFGVILLTKECLSLLRKRRGRILNVASVAGLIAPGGAPAYCASKFACVGFSDCLRREMKKWGISVSTMEPGFHKSALTTNIPGQAKAYMDALPEEKKKIYGSEFFKADAEVLEKIPLSEPTPVIDAMCHGIAHSNPKTHYLIGNDAFVYGTLSHFPAGFLDSLMKRLEGAMRRKVPPALTQEPGYWEDYN